MGLEEIHPNEAPAVAAQRAPKSDASTLADILAWAEREARFETVPEFRVRPSLGEVDLWLWPEAGMHDDRLPPHGTGKAATLYEAWVLALEALTADLYRHSEARP